MREPDRLWRLDRRRRGGDGDSDASDPSNPTLAKTHAFNPTLRAGQVQVIGSLLMVTAAEGPRTALLDVSIPDNPQPIAGGDFGITDSLDQPRESYFSNWSGGYGFYAIKDGGGGVLIYDLHDPSNPSNPSFYAENKSGGNGGYVFVKDELAFVGESSIARIYDWSDPTDVSIVAELDLDGDLDTMTPIGNVAVLSVDDEANPNQGSAMVPYAEAPDSDPPRVTFVWPPDGATGIKLTSRFGVSFSEMVEPKSAWAGSVRLYETGTDPALTRVDGWISTQEAIVNFAPMQPLKPGTSYTLEITADGVVDYPEILLGKQLINDSFDPKLAKHGYIACAHCHLDGEAAAGSPTARSTGAATSTRSRTSSTTCAGRSGGSGCCPTRPGTWARSRPPSATPRPGSRPSSTRSRPTSRAWPSSRPVPG